MSLFHRGKDLLALNILPGSCDNNRFLIMLAKEIGYRLQFFLVHGLGTADDNGSGAFYLIVEELAEILHIHFGLVAVDNSYQGIYDYLILIFVYPFYRFGYIRELADARGLDDDALRRVGFDDLGQGFLEITHQRAADTAGVHFRNIDPGLS